MRKKPCSSPCSTQTHYPSNVPPQGNQYAHGTWYDTHPTDTPTICNQPVGLPSGIISAPADNLDRVAALEQTRDMLVHAFARKRQAQFSRPSQAARLRRQSCTVRHPAWLGVHTGFVLHEVRPHRECRLDRASGHDCLLDSRFGFEARHASVDRCGRDDNTPSRWPQRQCPCVSTDVRMRVRAARCVGCNHRTAGLLTACLTG